MQKRLINIGRFARLTGLTVRALRLYDEVGLLRPETVDEQTNYRYYTADQLEQAQLIVELRRVDMPLEEIARFLTVPEGVRVSTLTAHRDHLRHRASSVADALRAIDDLTKAIFKPGEQAASNVTSLVRKTLSDQPVMRICLQLGETAPEDSITNPEAAEIAEILVQQGLIQAGPPYGISYDPDESGHSVVEVGIPVKAGGTAVGRVEPGILAGGEVASTLYRGPQDCPTEVLRHLWSEMDAAGLDADDAPRWVWLTDPSETPDPQANLTEVIWPIR